MSIIPRITHLIVRLDTGGAENSLLRMIVGTQAQLRHQVICFGPPTPLGQKIERLGVQVSWLDYRRMGPLVLWQALQILRKQTPDVIQGWMYYGNILASVLAWVLNLGHAGEVKVAWNVRNAISDPGSDTWKIRGALAWARWCHPDLVIYNSFAGQQAHIQMSLHGRQVVIPNGIDLSEFSPNASVREDVRGQYQVVSQNWVGVVARFHQGKGIREYLQVVELSKQRSVPARFFLAGGGMTLDHPEFVALLSEVGLQPSDLDLLGPIDNVPGFLPAIDLLVLPSLREGTPNILLEAMACGVNTVATAVGDVPRILQTPARVAVPGDVQDLAEKIFAALAESEQERQKRVQTEREFLTDNYNAPVCMQAYCDQYQTLLRPVAGE